MDDDEVLISFTRGGKQGHLRKDLNALQLTGQACLACGGPLLDTDPSRWDVGYIGDTLAYVHVQHVEAFRLGQPAQIPGPASQVVSEGTAESG